MFFLRLIIVYLISINVLNAQQAFNFSLTIRNSNADLGTLYIGEPYYQSQYMAGAFEADSALYSEGVYKFSGKIKYLTPVRIFSLKKNAFNQLLFIEPGFNEAVIVIRDSILQFQTKTQAELEHKFFLQQMGITNIDERIPMKKFQAYVEQNSKSYIALFALIDQMFNYRFSPEMRSIAEKLDTAIRSTRAFSYFREQYVDRKKFVAIDVLNELGKTVTLNFSAGKYTLVDFWWIGCKPCYEDMKKLNQKVKSLSNQLNIVSINTDGRTEFEKSRERFSKEKLSWKSYWDFDGKMSEKNIFFYKYPTNLLVDSNGYIVATDIDIDRLEDFIKN